MRRTVLALACSCALIGAAACGRSEQEKQAEAAKQAADQMSKGAEQMAKGLEDMAKNFQAAAGGSANQKPVPPANFRDLESVFPDLSGWTKGKPKGEMMSTPVSYSEASCEYTKGDARLEAKITDSAFNQMLTMAFNMMAATGYSKESDDGYEKSAKFGEYPGWEKRDNAAKTGEIGTIIANRFIVEVNGHQLDDNKPLHDLLAASDLKKLASLK